MVCHQSNGTYAYFHPGLVIESHSENMPSLRIDKPFPSLLQHAMSLDLANMDPTDHGHVPYVVILVRVMEEWKSSVGGEGYDCAVRRLSHSPVAWRQGAKNLSRKAGFRASDSRHEGQSRRGKL